MIHFGQQTVNLGPSWKNVKHEVIVGYYLVCNDKWGNENRYWISSSVDNNELDRLCYKHLGIHNFYDYWIDYCMGYDVNRNLAWVNIDQTDKFI